ncbi:hypothetical protein ACFE04_025802 [Oxalis oulophora]
MSTMRRSDQRKPPLAKSPMRLRSRRASISNPQPPQGSFTKISQKPIHLEQLHDLRPEYHTISSELRALAKMVNQELGNAPEINNNNNNNINNSIGTSNPTLTSSSPLFERGRLYNEYSARRNERLKRKICGGGNKDPMGTPLKFPLTSVPCSKRRDSNKSVPPAYAGETNPALANATPRYALRSMTKENKKPPLPQPKSKPLLGIESQRKTALRRVRRL